MTERREVNFNADGIFLQGPIEELAEDIASLYINKESGDKISEMENIIDNGYQGDEISLRKKILEANKWIYMASLDLPEEALFHYEMRKLREGTFVIRMPGKEC